MLASASVGAPVALYEPVHGSAPDIAGTGTANPIGSILSIAMMLRYSFKLEAEAKAVEVAVAGVLRAGIVRKTSRRPAIWRSPPARWGTRSRNKFVTAEKTLSNSFQLFDRE